MASFSELNPGLDWLRIISDPTFWSDPEKYGQLVFGDANEVRTSIAPQGDMDFSPSRGQPTERIDYQMPDDMWVDSNSGTNYSVEYEPGTGKPIGFWRKVGDKKAAVYSIGEDGKPQYSGTVDKNTNENIFDNPIAVAMMLGVGAIGVGAAGAASGLWGGGTAPGSAAAGGASGEALGAGWVGEDLVGALQAGSMVPEGYTIPAALGGGTAGPGGFSLNPMQQAFLDEAMTNGVWNTIEPSIGALPEDAVLGGMGATPPTVTPPGTNTPPVTETPKKDGTGFKIDPLTGAAITAGAGLISDLVGGDDTQTQTRGTPEQQAAYNTILDKMMGGLDERVARDREASDFMRGLATRASTVGQGLTKPTSWLTERNGLLAFDPAALRGLFGRG